MAGGMGAWLLRQRRLVRAPIWLYKAGLGALMGPRMVMVEHRGRVSGESRFVVLEVVEQRSDGWVVVSGFGTRAQWFRNVVADSRVRVTSGGHGPVRARAHVLDADAGAKVLARYAAEHPRSWDSLRPIMESIGTIDGDDLSGMPVVLLSRV